MYKPTHTSPSHIQVTISKDNTPTGDATPKLATTPTTAPESPLATAPVSGTAPPPAPVLLTPEQAVQAAVRTHVKSLLDFVAWVAFQKSPNLRMPPGWLKGRGGFLMDEFKDVEAACKRVQVCVGKKAAALPWNAKCLQV